MSALQIFVLALVQGITEFLPISSSGHLVLVPVLFGWADQGPLMDVAVHTGTLLAVLVYFRKDTVGLLLAALGSIGIVPARRAVAGSVYGKLFWALVIATLPVVIAGFWLSASGVHTVLRTPQIIAGTSILFGVLLWLADRYGPRVKALDAMALKPALLIGLAQILALVPGTSRAGITMTAGLALGFGRQEAARFSMLLAIPTLIAAGTLAGAEIAASGDTMLWRDALIGAGLSFLAALGAIHVLMRWLSHAGMTPFVVYRIALGLVLIVFFWTGSS